MPLLGVHLTKGQLDTTEYHSWPLDASTGGTSDWRSAWPKGWLNVVSLLATRWFYQGGMSDQKSAWSKGWPNVKLTWCSTTLGHQMPLSWGCLTKGQPDPKIWQRMSTSPKASSRGGLSDLSAKRTSGNLNALCISCFASQTSFWKTNELQVVQHMTCSTMCHMTCVAKFTWKSVVLSC